jgi:hypothetical protein
MRQSLTLLLISAAGIMAQGADEVLSAASIMADEAISAPGITAGEVNLCRITNNYGCTTERGSNCNDEFAEYEDPVRFHPSVLRSCVGSAWSKSDDNNICCIKDNLNGGYCPNRDELEGYGFELVGLGYGQTFTAAAGPAVVKCNKRFGPHFCTKSTKIGAVSFCVDPGLYT